MRPALTVAVLLACACGPVLQVPGDGRVTTETRAVAGTTAVKLALPGTLTVELGGPPSLRIVAEENLLPYLTTPVRWGELVIGHGDDVTLLPTRELQFTLTVPSLAGLATTSSGHITAPELTADRMTLSVTSSGDIGLAGLSARTLLASISSSGDITIDEGEVTDQRISITSSGNYRAPNLRSATADVDISSSGDALLWVTDRLDVRISSSGNVRYYGSPVVTTHLSSSGTVAPLGAR